jgi:dipeptidyl aminopeptidase/acylaminoacyl peptidase
VVATVEGYSLCILGVLVHGGPWAHDTWSYSPGGADWAVGQGYAAPDRIGIFGDPSDSAQEADTLTRSPVTTADRIRTPLLVAQGSNDVRVVQAGSDNIVESLRARGIPVEYIVAEDEGHGFANPENQFRLYRAIERLFAEHLGGRRDTAGPV